MGVQRLIMDCIENLIRTYADDVLKVCAYYLGDFEQAEYAFREVFLDVAKKFNGYSHSNNMRAELFIVARRICGADIVRDDYGEEYRFYLNCLHLTRKDTEYILGARYKVPIAN